MCVFFLFFLTFYPCYHRSKQLTVIIMTATFVQLRHVVYLLVLLQCFLCVANASGVWRGYPTTGSAEMGKVDQVLRGRVARAHEQIAVMNGCLSALKEEMKLCEEGSRRAAAVAKN
ncbi:uncharacterized protein TM35_000131960, partial [Trypanosoma theileri]